MLPRGKAQELLHLLVLEGPHPDRAQRKRRRMAAEAERIKAAEAKGAAKSAAAKEGAAAAPASAAPAETPPAE